MPDLEDFSDLIPQIMLVDEETWERLMNMLDEPPKEIPAFKKLMSQKPPWTSSSEEIKNTKEDSDITANDVDGSSQ